MLVGKSMGGRVGCHVALEEPVAALICFGYPLCAARDRAKLRDEVLLTLKTPILFIQGPRDVLCPLDLLDDVRKKMTAPSHLHVVAGGDHSLVVSKTELKASGLSQADVDHRIGDAVAAFLRDACRSRIAPYAAAAIDARSSPVSQKSRNLTPRVPPKFRGLLRETRNRTHAPLRTFAAASKASQSVEYLASLQGT